MKIAVCVLCGNDNVLVVSSCRHAEMLYNSADIHDK